MSTSQVPSLQQQAALSHPLRRSTAWLLPYAVSIVFVLATRLPLIGNPGVEPDAPRYVLGLHLWRLGDRGNQLVFDKMISPGYYWLAAHLTAMTHTSLENYSLALSLLSLFATLLMIPALYEISRWLTGTRGALLCVLLFLVTPAMWWLSIEAHPQAISVCLSLWSLYAFLRGGVISTSRPWLVISGLILVMALLARGDAVLLFPAYFGLLLFFRPWDRTILPALSKTVALLGATSLVFLAIRAWMLGTGLLGPHLEVFNFVLPAPFTAMKQAGPIVMAVGPVLFLFVIAGSLLSVSARHRESARWMVLLATWCLPGFLFYFQLPDNLPRHVAVYMLALIWAAVAGVEERFGRKAAAIIVIVAALNFVSVPPNSSNGLLMSPNVPGSVRALHAREKEIRTVAERASTDGIKCFVGTYTIPYFLLYTMEAVNPAPAIGATGNISWIKSDRHSIYSHNVEPYLKISMPCSPAYSLEYGPDGSKHRYFGKEIYSSSIWTKLTLATGTAR
jgi:4-amino-4-deoxy-L-arabinose transferase-like glycosyltransferase